VKRGSDWHIELILAACFLLVGLLLTAAAGWASCVPRWERSGMRVEWGPISGCLVQRQDGTWIPSENLRDVAGKEGTGG